MKIAIIGSGAMGCLYGGLLAEGGNEVYLIDIWKEHVDTINEKGLNIKGLTGERVISNIKATTDSKEIGKVELALVFVKSTSTGEAARENKDVVDENTVVLTLQNGLGNLEKLMQVWDSSVIAGTTAHGATLIGPGSILHAGQGKTIIGEVSGLATKRIEWIQKVFNDSRIDTDISDNVMGLIWDKLLVNIGINAITALTGLRNGQLLEHEETEWILEEAVKEAFQIAQLKGIRLHYEDPIAHTKDVCRATAENKASMLQDVIHKRETEIKMINGAIADEAEKYGVITPVNKLLTNLILMKEKLYEIV